MAGAVAGIAAFGLLAATSQSAPAPPLEPIALATAAPAAPATASPAGFDEADQGRARPLDPPGLAVARAPAAVERVASPPVLFGPPVAVDAVTPVAAAD
ncbi:MAG: hypothetical protein OES57_14935, partial [Acidimicrobiia bacterium]|nr:hypothetical protein [Acidimicrobiia bacterium]